MSANGKKVFRMTVQGGHEGATVWSTESLTLQQLFRLLKKPTEDRKRTIRIPLGLEDSAKKEWKKAAHFLTIELSE